MNGSQKVAYDYGQRPKAPPICRDSVWRRVGEVDRLNGAEAVCVRVTESSAVYVVARTKEVDFKDRFDDNKNRKFKVVQMETARVTAARFEPPIRRLTAEQFQDFVATGLDRTARRINNTGQETGDSMAKNKSTRPPRGGLAAEAREDKASKGALGALMGSSVVSVLRVLGREGVTVPHARAIMKAQGVKVADATVSIQVNAGKNGKTAGKEGKKVTYAELTQAQIKELIGSAAEPKEEKKEAAEKK